MTLDEFWKIVETVHRESGGDMDRKCTLLDAQLRRLPLEEVRSFQQRFDECLDRAYTWELWGAAYVIGGGCSDDAFSDFRSTLISSGRQPFEAALADPQRFADPDFDADGECYEGYQYVATSVESDLAGGETAPRYQSMPASPSGARFDEATLANLYPRLATRFKF